MKFCQPFKFDRPIRRLDTQKSSVFFKIDFVRFW